MNTYNEQNMNLIMRFTVDYNIVQYGPRVLCTRTRIYSILIGVHKGYTFMLYFLYTIPPSI